jgi:hypothetical protein
VIAAGFTALVLIEHAAGAADVHRSAEAAEHAKTFTFESTSVLSFAGGPPQTATETGAIDLSPGERKYKVRITAGRTAAGFERIIFPHTLYIRHISTARPGPWREIPLAQPARIAPKLGGSSGISDPLGLLAVLRTSHGATKLHGAPRVRGTPTTHFALRSTLGAFLSAESVTAPPSLAGATVHVDVWLDSDSRVLRAQRRFILPGPRRAQLLVTTEFAGYGLPVMISAPAPKLRSHRSLRLNPVAEDPLSASVLGALLFGSRHPATPTIEQ